MLQLIAGLESVADERAVWVLLSVDRLCLLSRDSYEPPWPVVVEWTKQGYKVEYSHNVRMPGHASTTEEAVERVLLAMDKSLAWV